MSEKLSRGIITSESSALNEVYGRSHMMKGYSFDDQCRNAEKAQEDIVRQKRAYTTRNNQVSSTKEIISQKKKKINATESYNDKNKLQKQTQSSKGLPSLAECAEALLQKITIINYGNHLYYYNGRYYQQINDMDVLTLYRDYVDKKIGGEKTVSRIGQLYKFLLSESKLKKESIPMNLPMAVLENGIYDIVKQKLYRHTSKVITFSCINAKYVEDEKCPVFEQFLSDVTGNDEVLIERLWMFLGYVLMQTVEAKSFFIMGLAPDSGKSVLGNFIESLFPRECVSNIALNDLNKNFSLAPIVGSAVNISLDLPSSRLNADAVSSLKMLTGGDVVTINEKYVPKFSYSNRAKFIFATNNSISLAEQDRAFWNRLVYLPFNYTVPKKKQDRCLQRRLDKEKNAIVSKALGKARKLLKNNFVFPTTPSIERQVREWQGLENPTIDGFVDEYCVLGKEYAGETVERLYCVYEQYCYDSGYEPRSRTIFKNYLENTFNLKHTKMRLGAENPRSAFKGIAIRGDELE